jgi:hypothetical protein
MRYVLNEVPYVNNAAFQCSVFKQISLVLIASVALWVWIIDDKFVTMRMPPK